MQVKVCPKCNAENKAANAACSNCYASLDGAAVTEGSGPAPVRAQAPRPAKTPAAAAAPVQQVGATQQTQMGTMAPPPSMPPQSTQYGMLPPVKKRSMAGIIVLVVFIVLIATGGFGFLVLKSGLFRSEPLPTESPATAVVKFLEAKKTGVLSNVEPYLSKQSVYRIHNTFGSRQAQSAGFGSKVAADLLLFGAEPTAAQMAGKQIAASEVKGDKEADERMAIVSVVVDKKPEAPPAPKPLLPPGVTPPPEPEQHADVSSLFDPGPIEVEFVMVAEDGQWKVDLAETNRRSIGLGKPGNPFIFGK